MDIPACFYRVSIKALALDESRTKFLVVQEENGLWELPGGGLDWGTTPEEGLRREIREEMGLGVMKVANNPSYFMTFKNHREHHVVNLFYEVELKDLAFTPSDECVEIRFVTPEQAKALTPQMGNVAKLADMFDPQNHVE